MLVLVTPNLTKSTEKYRLIAGLLHMSFSKIRRYGIPEILFKLIILNQMRINDVV